ncbi:MAG: PIN domain nuclease [Eubacterium sp.]|nr:PIN domain nuclease [Eubacterium sp.]
MFKNLIRVLSALIGAVLGYGMFGLVKYVLGRFGVSFPEIVLKNESVAAAATAIISGILFFIIAPAIADQGVRLAKNLGKDLQNVSAGTIGYGAVGLLFGLMIATLLAQLFRIIPNQYVYAAVVVVTYAVSCYLCAAVAAMKGKDFIRGILSLPGQSEPRSRSGSDGTSVEAVPKVFDTSVIIDGRIAGIMKAGFLEGPVIIPDFVLVELRHIADSADSLKRTRGRRGLDILNSIREEYGVEIYNTDNEKVLKEIPEVDVKLLKLAELIKGDVVTNDFNLNKVAGINGVRVLNINELANCLKPLVIPGEDMLVTLMKEGKNREQAIGYLDDGTMIVVENGHGMIGTTQEIRVTSVLQTSAGRMIFGRLKTE